MARRLRSTKIENRTDRLALPRRRAPHGLTNIAPGMRLGYRRTKGAGTWVLECANGKGGEWQSRVGVADDYEDADGEHVLTFWQAADKARTMARGTSTSAPSTWADAIDDYEADLVARGGAVRNATHVRYHLRDVPTLLNKPVALLTAAELKRWRNDLVANSGLKLSSVVRVLKTARASLNLAASHDPRIQNRETWRVGLGGLHDSYESIDRVQPDDVVRRIIAEAYADDAALGLFVHVAAETGARASQIARLVIADLVLGRDPKLSMPSSRKGKRRAITRRPVPISTDLATRLQRAAKGRPPEAPLLVRDGEAWVLTNHKRLLQEPFAEIAKRLQIEETMYCLRHSSIVRALLHGVPAQLVASNHDTSLQMLQRTYARFISQHGEDVARRGLLDLAPVTVPA
jgi:integrase